MVRSFLRVQAVQPGFRSDSVLAFDVLLPNTHYPVGGASQGYVFRATGPRVFKHCQERAPPERFHICRWAEVSFGCYCAKPHPRKLHPPEDLKLQYIHNIFLLTTWHSTVIKYYA